MAAGRGVTQPSDPPGTDLASVAAGLAAALHDGGVAVPTSRTASFAAALAVAAPASTRELYWLARVTLLTDHAQLPAFERVFGRLFGTADEGEIDPASFRGDRQTQSVVSLSTPLTPEAPAAWPAAARRWAPPALVAQHLSACRGAADRATEPDEGDAVLTALSSDELLRRRDLAELAEAELADLRRLLSRTRAEPPMRRGRRTRPSSRGRRVDLRATLRAAVRTGGDPHRLVHRRPRPKRRRLVLLCDVSGSMEAYARPYLQLLSGAALGAGAEAFVFATRLTCVSRTLRSGSAVRLAADVARAAPDWGGGTRIGAALRSFLDGYGRRGLARGAVVVVLSDGWEADEPTLLEEQMRRLARLAHRVIWVNPRVAAESFRPLTGGLRAALPSVDVLVSGHSLAAMEEVLAAVRG